MTADAQEHRRWASPEKVRPETELEPSSETSRRLCETGKQGRLSHAPCSNVLAPKCHGANLSTTLLGQVHAGDWITQPQQKSSRNRPGFPGSTKPLFFQLTTNLDLPYGSAQIEWGASSCTRRCIR